MDIGGIKRLTGIAGSKIHSEIRKNQNSSADRDADGRQSHDQRKDIKQLTPEQEEKAVEKLIALPSFRKAGLTARLIKEAGKATHVVVLNSKGEVVRHLPYEQLIDLYLDRNSEIQSGRLLKRAA